MDLETRKRQRKGTLNGREEDTSRNLKCTKAFDPHQEGLELIHAIHVASLEHKCVPIMGAQTEDVAIELQYPSLQPPEKYFPGVPPIHL